MTITMKSILTFISHTISAEQLLPVLFSLPESETAPSLPFKFTGGFDLPTRAIGGILSAQGLIQVIAMLFAFPVLTRYLGSLTLFRITVLTYPFLYIVTPYLTLVPSAMRMPCVYLILVWKVCAQAFTMPSALIMLANNTPSPKVSGTLNGAMAASASLCRTFGPTFSGLLQSAGLSLGTLGLPWWTNAAVAVLGAVIAVFMREEKRRTFNNEKEIPMDDEPEHDEALNEGPNASLETLQSMPTSPLLTRPERRGSAL
jgi:MFS family permease